MRRWLAALSLAALWPALAQASQPRLRLERIDPAELFERGTVRIYASLVELEGQVIDDRAAPQFSLWLDGKPLGPPVSMTRFVTTREPIDLVLVVEASALYGRQRSVPLSLPVLTPQPGAQGPPGRPGLRGPTRPAAPPKRPRPRRRGRPTVRRAPARPGPPAPRPAPEAPRAPGTPPPKAGEEPLERVKDATRQLLESLGPTSRVLIVEYGGEVTAHPPFRAPQAALPEVDDLVADEASGDLRLVEAVRAALAELAKPAPAPGPRRRLVVLVSDGLNDRMDRRTFRALGDAAAEARVPIHSIAFSPTDERGPLLNLGEISKRSRGTFRWARSAEDLRAQIETLADEVNRQYVLTFRLSERALAGRTFELRSEDLASGPYSIDASTLKDLETARLRQRNRWAVAAGGAAVLALLLATGTFLVVSRRRRAHPRAWSGWPGGGARQGGGAAAPAPSPFAAGPLAAAPYAVPRVQILAFASGALAGQQIPLPPYPLSLGSGNCSVRILDDRTVSGQHAQIVADEHGAVLIDLGSTNGTFVNDRRVTQPVRLANGDLVRLGQTLIAYREG